jgi:hypothetical protein
MKMHSVFAEKHGTRIIDLSAPSNERVAVIRPCVACTKDVPVASDFQGSVFCSDKCKKDTASVESQVRDTLQKFADTTPEFYRCQHNVQQLVEAYQGNRISDWTVKHLKAAFTTLSAEGKLLLNISLKDIQKMSPEEYDKRLRLDPDLGGHKTAIDGGALSTDNQRRPVESAQPGFTPGNRIQQMQRMAERELNAVVQSRTNRYKISAFQNGEPVDAPQLQQGLQQFRNGRLVR